MKKHDAFRDLASLFFETRQIIRGKLPDRSDPNTWPHLETVAFIARSKDPTMQDIARFLRVKAPSATSLIAHLSRGGLIERRSQGSDKRVVRIYLTARGKRELEKYRKQSTRTMREVFSKLEPKEVGQLKLILEKVKDIHHS